MYREKDPTRLMIAAFVKEPRARALWLQTLMRIRNRPEIEPGGRPEMDGRC